MATMIKPLIHVRLNDGRKRPIRDNGWPAPWEPEHSDSDADPSVSHYRMILNCQGSTSTNGLKTQSRELTN